MRINVPAIITSVVFGFVFVSVSVSVSGCKDTPKPVATPAEPTKAAPAPAQTTPQPSAKTEGGEAPKAVAEAAKVDPEAKTKVDPEEAKVDPEEKAKVDPEEAKVDPEEAKVDPEEAKVDPEEAKVDPEEGKAKIDPEEAKVDPEEGKAPVGGAPGDQTLVFAPEERMAASDCDAIVAKEYALVAESGTDEMKAGAAKVPQEENVAKCRARPYPKVAADCLRTATTAAQMFRECYTLPFQGRDLFIGREFKANNPENAAADPPMFTQHGDMIRISSSCGLLFQRLETFVGAFLVCDGQTQGPFTTTEDINQVFAAMSAEAAARHKMMMGIIANYPSGGTGRYRVCNSAGVCHTE